MGPPQANQSQSRTLVTENDRANKCQQAVKQVQDQLTELMTENEQLKCQLRDQGDVKSELAWLRMTDKEHRGMTGRFAQLAEKRYGSWRSPPLFYITSYYRSKNVSQLYRKGDRHREDRFLQWIEAELHSAKEAREGKWKDKIIRLEDQNEQQRKEMQTIIDTAISSITDLKLRDKELEERIHGNERSEKHCHQIINHLENLMAAHPGKPFTSGDSSIDTLHTSTSEAAVRRFAKWAGWVGEELRCAKELEDVRERSRKRRKIANARVGKQYEVDPIAIVGHDDPPSSEELEDLTRLDLSPTDLAEAATEQPVDSVAAICCLCGHASCPDSMFCNDFRIDDDLPDSTYSDS